MAGTGWLTLKRRGPEVVEYSVSLAYRVGFVLIAALILGALVAAAGPFFDRSNTVAFVLLGASVLAALYEERWIFSAGGIEYRIGVLGLARRRRWEAAQARCLRVVESKQAVGRPFVSLSVAMVEGRPLRVDMARGSAGERLREIADEVSKLSGIPVEK
jgi:hypothetical protein